MTIYFYYNFGIYINSLKVGTAKHVIVSIQLFHGTRDYSRRGSKCGTRHYVVLTDGCRFIFISEGRQETREHFLRMHSRNEPLISFLLTCRVVKTMKVLG